MMKLRWVEYECESKMGLKIEDPKQEWKDKSQDSELRPKLRLGNEHRQVVIIGSCKNI